MASPSPRPAVLAADRSVRLAEPFEDMREELRIDTRAVVADPDVNARRSGIEQLDAHTPAGVGELHGVRQQVPDDLLQPLRITMRESR